MADEITALIPLQGEQLLARVDEIVRRIGEDFYELGQHLFEIKTGEVYKDSGHGSWREYCDARLPFQDRKADHYIELWELFCQKLGYNYDEVGHVGWSKLSKITRMIETRDDAKKWIKTAESHSKRELDTLVKLEHAKKRGGGGPDKIFDHVNHDLDGELEGVQDSTPGPYVDPAILTHNEVEITDEETGDPVPLHQFSCYLYGEQWNNVMAAMQRAGQLTNSDKACYLLDMIATEFNSTYVETDDGGVAHKLEWHRKNLERIFGVEIEINVPADSPLREMSRLPKA